MSELSENELNKVYNLDCLEGLKIMDDNSVDAIVTDPPYGLSFMGKKWDYDVPSIDIWKECLRVLKPGGMLLSFAGTRTQHRMACNIEDVGFEIRDMIAWVYGSGFPKSHNIGKAIDKVQGNEREVIGQKIRGDVEKAKLNGSGYLADPANKNNVKQFGYGTETLTKGNSDWEGWGTALKPALEPITVARKPLSEKTVVANVLKHGTGGINIDSCRVGEEKMINRPAGNKAGGSSLNMSVTGMPTNVESTKSQGRFPANLIHDGSDEVVELFPGEENKSASRFFKSFSYTKNYLNREDINKLCYENLDVKTVEKRLQIMNVIENQKINSVQKNVLPPIIFQNQNLNVLFVEKNVENIEIKHVQELVQILGNGIMEYMVNGLPFLSMYDLTQVQLQSIIILYQNLVKSVEKKEKLDIMRIILNLKILFGCVEVVTTKNIEASRFKYQAKASKSERNQGLEHLEEKQYSHDGRDKEIENAYQRNKSKSQNFHPTVKPIKLMKYLCRLITQPNGIILDPFMGSGTTGIAAKSEGFNFIGFERDEEYCKLANDRIIGE